ncbi:MAG: hypothetical protein R3B09_30980 [Nannocystaceae bacterium]
MTPRRRRSSSSLILALLVAACGSPGAPEGGPAAAPKAAEAHPSADPAPADGPAAPAADAAPVKGLSQLEEDRAIAEAYAAGPLRDRLAAASLLLVDAKVRERAAQAQYFAFAGTIDPPRDLAGLEAARERAGAGARWSLLGGEDSTRPAILRDVSPGPYTVCALVSPPEDPEEARIVDEVFAESKAKGEDKLSAGSLAAMSAEVERRLGRPRARVSYDGIAPRCGAATVGDDPASRVVVLE